MSIFARVVLILTLLLARLGSFAQTEKSPEEKLPKGDPLRMFSESVQDLSATVTKSVVQVLTPGFSLSTSNSKTDTAYLAPERGIGAGVILSSEGYIVTNAHVVTGARKIRVRLQGMDTPGSGMTAPRGPIEARLVGLDRQTDLAVLKIDIAHLPAVDVADSRKLKQGQVVLAFATSTSSFVPKATCIAVKSVCSRELSRRIWCRDCTCPEIAASCWKMLLLTVLPKRVD
jgi:serine protease Do